MNDLTANFPFIRNRNTVLFFTAENGHPLVFTIAVDALVEAAGADSAVQPQNPPPHPFGPVTMVMPLLGALRLLADGEPIREDAPIQQALARWADFCIDAAAFIVEQGIDPEELFPRLWSRAENELQSKDDALPKDDATWTLRLEELAAEDLQRLAPNFCRERAVVQTRDMPNRSLGVTFYHGQVVLVLHEANRGLFLWPESTATDDEIEAFTWPWATAMLTTPVVMILARDLKPAELASLRRHGAAPGGRG